MKTPKSENTKKLILDTALRLFDENGYEGTTMRAIARDAGVSTGNAYYYFDSKESLIQAFYHRTHVEHMAACKNVLDSENDLKGLLIGVMEEKVNTIIPYKKFAAILLRSAVDQESPLNPFSEASGPVREEAIQLFAHVLSQSGAKVPERLARELPTMLWMYHMGVVFFWIHDKSKNAKRTRRLVKETVPLLTLLIRTSNFPLMRPVITRVLAIVSIVRGNGR